GSTWLAAETLAALRQVTRHDASPIPPWGNRYDALGDTTVRAQSLDGWLAWYQGAAERTYREWRSDSLEHVIAAEGVMVGDLAWQANVFGELDSIARRR
ncbi:MAG: hypothetical protein AAGC55_18870, partial [Myxococcota bacterium]